MRSRRTKRKADLQNSSFKGYQLGLGLSVEPFTPNSTIENNIAISEQLMEPNSWMCSEEDATDKVWAADCWSVVIAVCVGLPEERCEMFGTRNRRAVNRFH